jgi:LuxR family quorum sensing-dependent transcriptional regulator
LDSIDTALALRDAPTTGAALELLIRHAAVMGFPVIALGTLPGPDYPYPDDFVLTNWSDAWRAEYFEKGFGPHDPIRQAAALVADPVTVTEICAGAAGFMPTPEALAMLAAGAHHGISEGLVVPVFGPHGYRGLVCFFGARPEPSARERVLLHHLALHAHRRLHELHIRGRLADGPAALTAREVAVLRAARDGHRDAVIAEHMGVTVRTVRFHFENARRKLGTTTRAEALARAMNLHLI